jgi:hypothetical protein
MEFLDAMFAVSYRMKMSFVCGVPNANMICVFAAHRFSETKILI